MEVVKWRLRGCVNTDIKNYIMAIKNALFYADLKTVYEIGEKITKIVHIGKALVPFKEDFLKNIINGFDLNRNICVF
jgi:hypothetical protein